MKCYFCLKEIYNSLCINCAVENDLNYVLHFSNGAPNTLYWETNKNSNYLFYSYYPKNTKWEIYKTSFTHNHITMFELLTAEYIFTPYNVKEKVKKYMSLL